MSNPAFDAAMLLRGLRAMDAALGEGYNVASHTCIPAPVVYSSAFPEAGIDFSKYQGVEGLKGTWRGWMYEDGGKGQLKGNVHPDIEETAVEAFGILEKCDKSKDGHLTKPEWETCQRGRSAEDQLWDLEFLTALYNVTGKMLILEKNEPLNPANPDTYPELIQARADAQKTIAGKDAQISEKDGRISILKTDLGKVRDEAALYQKISYGLGSSLGLVALIFGIRALWRGRSRPVPPEDKPAVIQRYGLPQHPETKPRVVSDTTETKPAPEKPEPRVVKDTAGAKTVVVADDIADALKEIDGSKSPADGVRPSGPPVSGDVTEENVIITGDHAAPVSGVDAHVIRSQILLTYRHMMSQAAREALLNGQPLPTDDKELVNSEFMKELTQMVDRVTADYYSSDPKSLEDMWRTQLDDRGYIVRRGVPQRLLLSSCGRFMEEDAAKAQSPFAGGRGATIRVEAERRAGETDFFEKGMREWMRHIGRK
ncbi:MAG TPA: hypothetical protein VLJ37_05870 [bacterium]|nr:hypothetical protein [bacterium]